MRISFDKTLQRGEVRQVYPEICAGPVLVVASNTSMRDMLTGCLEAQGAQVAAAADLKVGRCRCSLTPG